MSVPRMSAYYGMEMWPVEEEPYLNLIKQFVSITRGDFTPTNIIDNFSPEFNESDFGFEFNGKEYKTTLSTYGGEYYDGGFLELINRAIKENGLNGKFYYTPQETHIYLTEEQYKALASKGVFNFEHRD